MHVDRYTHISKAPKSLSVDAGLRCLSTGRYSIYMGIQTEGGEAEVCMCFDVVRWRAGRGRS